MSHLNPGLISAYNSLTDKHLTGYFSNTRIRRHLQRAGLITRSGRIVPDKEYRHKLIQRAHQRHVRECLAQAIFHKVLEMERLHQIEIKKKLEEFARRERVHKIKVERSRRYEEDIVRILSPRPPTGARGIRKQHSGPECNSESSESPGSSRPNTAPGKMQRPVRLKPIHSNNTTASLRHSSPYRHHESSNENDPPFNCTMDKECRRRLTTMEASHGISPYCLPVINNFVTPVPPATKRKDRGVKVTQSSTLRGRRLRPATASSGVDITEDQPMLRSSVHQSRVCVNMVYFGKTVHLSNDLIDLRDEVKVFQQHCGGENLCVYKGKLREGESFQFVSRRHRGFPFSLTFFLNGLQVERLSSCCEFKHRKGSRLGGRHGHFGFSSVEGASPCYKCIIAMGLDKKPTPPPKRVKEEKDREEPVTGPIDAPEMEAEKTGGDTASDYERSQQQDMETQVEEETAAEEGKVRDDYEEDFEADDEGPAEEDKGKKSPSPTNETETQVKERDASETEDDERDEEIKSRSGSSCSGSDREASDAEATKDYREDEKPEQPKEVDQEESLPPPKEKEEPKPEEAAAATEAESAVANDSELQDSAGDSTEIDISDSSVPSGTENKQSNDTSEDKKAEKTVDEGKEEGQEQERAKSVQERLAEAMLTESHFTSEPELSDTTTEEEEEATDKRHEQSNDVAVVTETEEQQTVGETEVVQDLEETSEPRQQEDETGKEPHENSTKDEMVKIDEDDENCEDAAAEKETSEDTGADLHDVSEENLTEDNNPSEPQEGATAEPIDADAEQKDEDNGESTAVEEAQPGEMRQRAESSEEGESSVSELNKKTDEKAVSDNAEAEAMAASETMEMKAEPSEEQETLSCEEAPVTATEGRQQEDGEDRTEASETEVTAEDSADITKETADISEGSVKDEGNKDDIKEEEAERVLVAEASKDADQQEKMEEEPTENPVELDEEAEKEKSEEESKQEEKQSNSDETPEGENCEVKEKNETVKTEEEGNEENKTEERIENEEIIAEDTKTDSNTARETNEEPAEKTLKIEDKVANEERDNESEKTEKDKERESEETKNDEEEPEVKGAINDKTDEGEEIKETKTDANEGKSDKTEKEEKNDNENKAEQSESEKNKDDKESEEKEVACETGEEMSANTEKPEKNVDDVKISNENTDESQDIRDNEAEDETKTSEEMLNNITVSENVKKETEGAITNSEKGEIDAESGEISARAESKTHIDEPEASAEHNNVGKAAEHIEDERKMEEEPTVDQSTEVKEVSVKSGDDKVDQGPDMDVVECEDKEGEEVFEKQEESAQKDSEQETAVTEIEEYEESKNENGNKSDLDTENRDLDSIKDKDGDVHEALVAFSAVEAQSALTDLGLDGTTHVLNESSEMSDKHPQSHENAAAADLSAADGEHGADTEEASKASEEGASVLLKPQAQNNEADEAEESIALGKQTPEALAAEDSADLVTNWVTMHQTSKFFQTFVEPLEDLKEEASHTQESISSKEATESTELPRSESPLKMVKKSESEEEEEAMQKDESETRRENKVGAVEPDIESEQTENGGSHENDPTKDTVQEKEETVVQELIPKAETEDNNKESTDGQRKGSGVSLEDELQEGPSLTQNEIYKTEVDSIADTNYSVASGKPESVKEKQTTDKGPDLNEKQTEAEEIIDLLPSSNMEEHGERSASPDGLRDGEETQGKTIEQSEEVTEITDFTTSRSEDGSQEEPHNGEIQPKPSDGSINGERRDVQLIQDIKHTLGKDRLSTFSVDETLFGRSSYPLLTAAKTESGH